MVKTCRFIFKFKVTRPLFAVPQQVSVPSQSVVQLFVVLALRRLVQQICAVIWPLNRTTKSSQMSVTCMCPSQSHCCRRHQWFLQSLWRKIQCTFNTTSILCLKSWRMYQDVKNRKHHKFIRNCSQKSKYLSLCCERLSLNYLALVLIDVLDGNVTNQPM